MLSTAYKIALRFASSLFLTPAMELLLWSKTTHLSFLTTHASPKILDRESQSAAILHMLHHFGFSTADIPSSALVISSSTLCANAHSSESKKALRAISKALQSVPFKRSSFLLFHIFQITHGQALFFSFLSPHLFFLIPYNS